MKSFIEAADYVRGELLCETSLAYECPRGQCDCEPCQAARAYDAARTEAAEWLKEQR